ncbi:MAG: hypothetical protein ABI707_01665, partial [Ferruginibacter sp.]
MKAINKISQVVALIMMTSTLMFTVSCKKENSDEPTGSDHSERLSDVKNPDVFNKSAFSPWRIKSSGIAAQERGILEMSEPDQLSCYGIIFDGFYTPTHDITITHNGGATWHSQTVAGLENNYIYGIAATTASTVHLIGWNYLDGGGNVLRSRDGGHSWHREAPNAYTDAASFPDAIAFFNPADGVIIGDPQNGYFEIYTTSNGGNSWRRVPSKKIPAPLANEYGTAYQTDIYNNTIWTIALSLDNTGNVTGARLLQSDDKGLSWYVRNSSLTFSGAGDGTLKFRNRFVGLYKNNGILYRTTDGGTTWKVVHYSGKWFSFDFDNVPGKPGWWVSTGGGPAGT